MTTDNDEKWLKRIERERASRKIAEQLLEQKSLILYETNEKLKLLNDELEAKVSEKTKELMQLNSELEKKVEDKLSELRERDNLLIQQSRFAAMGEMIANIAHQWRQPLNVIGLIAQDLYDSYIFNDLNQEYFEKSTKNLFSQLEYMSQTIDDFRNFFKPSNNTKRFLSSVAFQKGVAILATSFKMKAIDFKFEVLNEEKEIIGDMNQLSQVFLNIVKNSQDVFEEKNHKNPKIDVIIETNNKYCVIKISDNAGGIPETIINKIFDPYFTTKHESVGTGLGLYMSKMIITNNMKGSIEAYNNNDGAEFIISIPLASDDSYDELL